MQTALAQRYAQSLYFVSQKQGIVSVIEQDLSLIAELLKQQAQFGDFLSSPVQKRQQKSKLVTDVFENKVNSLTLNFLGLLVRNWRAGLLSLVINEFKLILEKEKGFQRASITSAQPLDDSQVESINQKFSKSLGKKFLWKCEIDPSLVAGFRVRIGDKVIDHSLALKLKELEKQLMAKA